ncbi:coiled-coil domain-containing protein [Paenibacillus enshidis]|uniref:Coiled-coil domain-containing protein n=1 Tax=Paenibacillus enshidis TaxID=1458439 RepID=A0ABV5APR0_9BACL
MRRQHIGIKLAAALLCLSLWTSLPVKAAAIDEQTRKILEDSLSIVEIDQEIERIGLQQAETQRRQQDLQKQLGIQRQQIQLQQERAGAVVRSYYMGERDQLLSILLGAKNLGQALTLIDYYEIIISNDKDILNAYQERYASISKLERKTSATASELQDIKNRLLAQRTRVTALQERVNKQVNGSGDSETMRRLIEEMTSYWENIGLYEVRRHFKALAGAMEGLPQFIKGQKGAIVTNGKTYTVTIQEEEFNRFLQSRDELFKQFGFTFEKEGITVQGKSGTMDLLIKGHYTLENTPKNAIVFHVDRLVFNGLELPDTTRSNLEKQFDLGFYPQMLLPYVKATGVETLPQQLKVQLELSL